MQRGTGSQILGSGRATRDYTLFMIIKSNEAGQNNPWCSGRERNVKHLVPIITTRVSES